MLACVSRISDENTRRTVHRDQVSKGQAEADHILPQSKRINNRFYKNEACVLSGSWWAGTRP